MRIIFLGGEFQPEAQVIVGSLLKKSAENFHVNKLFVGTDGFNEEGAMAGDLMRAEAVHNMAQSARRTMILTESKKFSQVGVVSLLTYSDKGGGIVLSTTIEKNKNRLRIRTRPRRTTPPQLPP